MNEIIQDRINRQVEAHLPNGAGTMTEVRFRHALEAVAITAFSEGERAALAALMTTDEMAAELGVSVRRVQALVKSRPGVGWQVSRGTWLFRRDEIEKLRPRAVGRPKKSG